MGVIRAWAFLKDLDGQGDRRALAEDDIDDRRSTAILAELGFLPREIDGTNKKF